MLRVSRKVMAGWIGAAALIVLNACGSDGGTNAYPDLGIELFPCSTPGIPCNAHNPCAIEPICGDDGLCRPRALQNCDDGLACTEDICLGSGKCQYNAISGQCALPVAQNGKSEVRCFQADQRHPEQPCKICAPEISGTTWSPATGGSCNDGDDCTKDDYCDAGKCKGTYFGDLCADNLSCTENKCDGKGGCLPAKLQQDACLINGTCYAAGDKDADGCGICDPTQSVSGWTAISLHCKIDGKCYAPGDKNTDGCSTCDPTASTSAWTPLANHCLIDGQCYKDGDKDTSTCGECDSSASTSAWTVKGDVCLVGGNCFKAGEKDTTGCAICDTAKSKNKLSSVPGPLCVDWVRPLKSSIAAGAERVVVGTDNNPYLSGAFFTDADLGNGQITAPSSGDRFIASYTNKGDYRFAHAFKFSSFLGQAVELAVDPTGGIFVGLQNPGSVTVGSNALTPQTAGDALIIRYANDGAVSWSKQYADATQKTAEILINDLAVNSAGELLFTGDFLTAANFGGGQLAGAAGVGTPGPYGFLARVDKTGAYKAASVVGGKNSESGAALGVDSQGNVIIAGVFSSTTDMGGGTLTSAGSDDIFIVKRDSSGKHLWQTRAGGSGSDRLFSLCVDSKDNIIITGAFENTADFSATDKVTSKGSLDAYIAKYDSSGKLVYVKGFGGLSADAVLSVVCAANDALIASGVFSFSVDFGAGAVSAVGSSDIFLMHLDASGKVLQTRTFGSSGTDSLASIAQDSTGAIYGVGWTDISIDLDHALDMGSGFLIRFNKP
ncbi:MAG: hypothetical protein H6707_20650 [Deltaproteobacteria bacterium]|nr:hypothetical protein [Deltaproteobacteria bacterium]